MSKYIDLNSKLNCLCNKQILIGMQIYFWGMYVLRTVYELFYKKLFVLLIFIFIKKRFCPIILLGRSSKSVKIPPFDATFYIAIWSYF